MGAHTHTLTGLVVGLNPQWQWWASHSALLDTRDYPGASRQSQNVNPQSPLLVYCWIWIFFLSNRSSSFSPAPLFLYPSLSILSPPALQAPSSTVYRWHLTPSSPPLKSLDPCFLLESDKDSSLVLSYPFFLLMAQPSLSAQHWSPHPQENKTRIILS